MWPKGTIRVLAGCAPRQPFSSYRRGTDTSHEAQWPLIDEVSRLVEGTKPEIVTMENVPRIGSTPIFKAFVDKLEKLGYSVHHESCHCPAYGVPQHRRRMVLVASLLGEIRVPRARSHPPTTPPSSRPSADSRHSRTARSTPPTAYTRAASSPQSTWRESEARTQAAPGKTGVKSFARLATESRPAPPFATSTPAWSGTNRHPPSRRCRTTTAPVASVIPNRTALSPCAKPRSSRASRVTTSSSPPENLCTSRLWDGSSATPYRRSSRKQ